MLVWMSQKLLMIHVKPPREFYSSPVNQPYIWRLNKALYGLKNSPKLWQTHLVRVMVDQFKMSQLKSDACVFKNTSDSMFILSYVDDLLIIGEESEINAFMIALEKVFNLKHTTHLTSGTWIHFPGRNIHRRSESVIEISMMEGFMKSIYEVKTSTFPPESSKLQWLASVRPDIQFADKELSRKLSAPTTRDESAAKHLILYLRGARNLVFRVAPTAWRSNQCIELHAYCDPDWAGCRVRRKSTTGVICQL
eukprot:4438370-Amphidinium_carterae.2